MRGGRFSRDEYKPGDYNVICDRTGFKVKASTTSLEWDGLRVMDSQWETRQPQDFVRGLPDNQTVPDARPEQAFVFIGNTDSAQFRVYPGGFILAQDGQFEVIGRADVRPTQPEDL